MTKIILPPEISLMKYAMRSSTPVCSRPPTTTNRPMKTEVSCSRPFENLAGVFRVGDQRNQRDERTDKRDRQTRRGMRNEQNDGNQENADRKNKGRLILMASFGCGSVFGSIVCLSASLNSLRKQSQKKKIVAISETPAIRPVFVRKSPNVRPKDVPIIMFGDPRTWSPIRPDWSRTLRQESSVPD